MMAILDWRPYHDERSLDYPIRTALPAAVPRMERTWRTGPVLDQGNEGACVGFGWAAELMAAPMPWQPPAVTEAQDLAHRVYQAAKLIDYWPGEDYSGTSVLAGAKVIQNSGWIDGYRWAFSLDDVRDTLITTGPVIIGIWWLESMFRPRPSGLLEVHGRRVGGHCLVITGYHPAMRLGRGEGWFRRYEIFRLRQSWGSDHGRGGDIFILADDLERLLADDGEACVPVGRKNLKDLL